MQNSSSTSASGKGDNLESLKLKEQKFVQPVEEDIPKCLKDLYPIADVKNINDALVLVLHGYMLEVGFIPRDVPESEKLKLLPKNWRDSGVYKIMYYHLTCPELSCLMTCIPLGQLLSIFGTTDDVRRFQDTTLCFQVNHYMNLNKVLLDEKFEDPSKMFLSVRKLSRKFKDNFAYRLLATMQHALGFGPSFGLAATIDHIKLQILSDLPVQSVAAMSCVNREFNALCNASSLWKKLCLRDFPTCIPTSEESNLSWKELYKKRYLMQKKLRVLQNIIVVPPVYPGNGCQEVHPRINPYIPNFNIGIPEEIRHAFPQLQRHARHPNPWDPSVDFPELFGFF